MRATTRAWTASIGGAVILVFFAWLGIAGAIEQWAQATTVGRVMQTVLQMTYGIGAVLCLAAGMRPFRGSALGRTAWLVGATGGGGLAPVVWGGLPIWVAPFSTAGSFFAARGVLWLLDRVQAGAASSASR